MYSAGLMLLRMQMMPTPFKGCMDICVIGVGGGTVCGQRKKQSIDEVVGSLLDI